MQWVDFHSVKSAVGLEAVLQHYQVPGLQRRWRRQEAVGRCPIHRGRRDDSFRAHLAKNVFHCFACQARGTVLDFVAAMEKCSLREAALQLQRWFVLPGCAFPKTGVVAASSGQNRELAREKEGRNPPLHFVLTGIDPSHPYLQQRGIDPATAAAFGVGYYGRRGLLSGRIVIPIRNQEGELVAYAGRALDGELPKYRLPAGFGKGLELFNLDRALATGSHTVIVVEGYFDCLRLHLAGFPCVVALMGTSLSRTQQTVLVNRFPRIVLMLDGDRAGRSATEVIRTRLSPPAGVGVVHVPEGAQPDQLALPLLQCLLLSVMGQASADAPEEEGN